jgi:signal transduction histidine kinase
MASPRREILFQSTGDSSGEWDADRLREVIGNLLANALQHGSPMTPVSLVLQEQGEQVTIEVNNQGAPIADSDIGRLFEPYRQGTAGQDEPSGHLGLGLSIVNDIVNAHQGRIEVSSSDHGGTTFRVMLPRK